MPFLSQQPALNASLPISEANVTNLTADLAGKTAKATLTTKGDIYAASAASTPARVAVGADATVLTADAASTAGVKWAPGGGSQAFKRVAVPIAFNTPNLVLTGVPIYTPAAGDTLLYYGLSYLSVTSVWDGSGTPQLHFGVAGALDVYTAALSSNAPVVLTSADVAIGAHAFQPIFALGNEAQFVFADATPLTAMIDDGAGGDPGSTHGVGEIVLFIGAA